MLSILFFVILIHVFVGKCKNYWSNEISDSVVVEIQDIDEQRSIVDFYSVVGYISLISFIYLENVVMCLTAKLALTLFLKRLSVFFWQSALT